MTISVIGIGGFKFQVQHSTTTWFVYSHRAFARCQEDLFGANRLRIPRLILPLSSAATKGHESKYQPVEQPPEQEAHVEAGGGLFDFMDAMSD